LHKYWDGSQWAPSWDSAEDLGGSVTSVVSSSWGESRLDIVGKVDDGSYVHKAFTGQDWFPSVEKWEDFGGNFSSDPAVLSWAVGHVDIVGISAKDGTIQQKYYQNDWSDWADLGGGPFVGNPVLSSWGPGRLDIWAIDESGELNHLFWDGSQWQGWEKLGGKFTETPKVVHWSVGKINIVGKYEDGSYHIKNYDNGWNGWWDLSKDYASEPELLAKNGTSKSNLPQT
jgi:hypothetical protein